jgi:hypothetical protein
MDSNPAYRLLREVRDTKGGDRLLLWLVRDPDVENAWNFDALIWEIRANEEWTESVVLCRDELQGAFPRRHWAADIAGFDAASAHAIIKIGECSEPDPHGVVYAVYSWWVCDVRNKRLVELIRQCGCPDERYDNAD